MTPERLARAAQHAEARDLWGLATEIYAAARDIADIDAFHLLVVHHGEELPMHYVLFAAGDKTWPGGRHPLNPSPTAPASTGETASSVGEVRRGQDTFPIGVGDSLALNLRHTVGAPPSPYGAAFDIYPSQLYVPILLPSDPNIAYRMSDVDPPAPLGVLCVLSGGYDFFTPCHRRTYESLAFDSALQIACCLGAAS